MKNINSSELVSLDMLMQSPEVGFLQLKFSNSDLRKEFVLHTFLKDEVQSYRDEKLCFILLYA